MTLNPYTQSRETHPVARKSGTAHVLNSPVHITSNISNDIQPYNPVLQPIAFKYR